MMYRRATTVAATRGLMLMAAGQAAAQAEVHPPAQTPTTMPSATPYAMRGVELGMTYQAFLELPVIADEHETNLHAICRGDPVGSAVPFDDPRPDDDAAGITSCQWFGVRSGFASSLYIDLGAGKGPPVFDFIDDGGTRRLFRIRFFAHSQYAGGILDALNRRYGSPQVVTSPFQTLSGATFSQARSTWDNGVSSIRFTVPCRQLERYCLEYRHARLGALYDALMEQRAAAAASKL